MSDAASRPTNPLIAIGVLALIVVGLLFLPLAIAIFEETVLRSHHFEEFLRRIGVHGFFGEIYEAVGID